MKPRRWILFGSLVAYVVLGEAVTVWVDPVGPDLIEVMACAVAPSHGSLLAVWAALGGRATPWRLVIALITAVLWIWVTLWCDTHYAIRLVCIGTIQMVASSVLLMTARLFGAELVGTLDDDVVLAVEVDRPWVQFSLRSILSWTAAVAVLLSTLHYFPRESLRIPAENGMLILGTFVGGGVLIALGALWIALGARWPVVRWFVLGLTAVVAGIAIFVSVDFNEGPQIAVFLGSQITFVTGSFWLVRLAGYRLIWRRRVGL